MSDAKTPAIFNRIIEVLKQHLTKDEWVAFCEELDGCVDIYECVAEIRCNHCSGIVSRSFRCKRER